MAKPFNANLAKEYAMSDIGLTADEADYAIDNFYSALDDESRCDTCGNILTEQNSKNWTLDDYCNKCWLKQNPQLTN